VDRLAYTAIHDALAGVKNPGVRKQARGSAA
jgi:hypothetical protein